MPVLYVRRHVKTRSTRYARVRVKCDNRLIVVARYNLYVSSIPAHLHTDKPKTYETLPDESISYIYKDE